ncbi:thioredoxin-like protein [Leucosporidium creatinivorum]|uniref:Thioredoxin n=1 Tax=Leucosporidium creatinivorum TaxID=106004 RepID=A0A1Y2EM23_9BASI|nr:thioredoxin-like protein [Leucosporidium creatinivorum]
MSLITHLKNLSELNTLLAAKKDRLVVIDFHATWCGPCHAIAPKYEALSQQYRDVTFCKVDVDAAADIAKEYSIRAMPTFTFHKGGAKVDEVKGANAAAIEAALRKHSSGGGSQGAPLFPGTGHTLSGAPAPGDGEGFGYLKVFVIVGLLWVWYTYSKGGEDQIPGL